jgi:hypothetical protein
LVSHPINPNSFQFRRDIIFVELERDLYNMPKAAGQISKPTLNEIEYTGFCKSDAYDIINSVFPGHILSGLRLKGGIHGSY